MNAEPTELLPDESALQIDENGNLRHLLTLKGLDKALLVDILDDAETFLTRPGDLPARSQSLAGRTVGNLFFEASTRTRSTIRWPTTRTSAASNRVVIASS